MAAYQIRETVRKPAEEPASLYADHVINAFYSAYPSRGRRDHMCSKWSINCGEFSSDFTHREICIIATGMNIENYEQFCDRNKIRNPYVTFERVNGVNVCSFGSGCKNRDKCPCLHPDQKACSFGSKCNKQGVSCTYLHPCQKPCNKHGSFVPGCSFYHKFN